MTPPTDPVSVPPGLLDLGGITLQRVIEQQQPMFDAADFFAPTLTAEVLADERAALREQGALSDEDELVVAVQSYVLRTTTAVVMVDTCVGNQKVREQFPRWSLKELPYYETNLSAAGLRPTDVDVVVSTHLHSDHVGWNTRWVDGQWVPTFPNARYLFVAEELEYWLDVHHRAPVPAIADSVIPILDAGLAEVVPHDAELADGIRLQHTPGHTPGHVVVRVDGGDGRAVITGDLLHSPIQVKHPDICMTRDVDMAQSARSRHDLLAEIAAEPTLLCTAHFPLPSTGRVRPAGRSFVFDPD